MIEIKKTGNELINEILDEKISMILQRFKSSQSIIHNPTKGTGRESCIIEVLKEIVPNWVGVSSGIAFDRSGKQSPQLDIVLYNKNAMPVFFQEQTGFFPIDTLIYTIEVKSKLTAQELKDTIDKYNKLKELKNSSGNYINTVLFAYSTDITKKNELNRLLTNYPDFVNHSNINVIVSANIGNIFFFKEDKLQNTNIIKRSWQGFENCSELDAIKMFLMQIMNTLHPINIGQYIYKNQKINGYSDIFVDENNNVLFQKFDDNGKLQTGFNYNYNGVELKIDYFDAEYPPYDE